MIASGPMETVAKVLSDVALDREFDYRIPERLLGQVQIGSCVRIPFGHREIRGFVTRLCATSEHPELKPILGLIGDRPLILPEVMTLARWMAHYYCAPVESAVRAILPSAVRRKNGRHKERKMVEAVVPLPAGLRLTEKQRRVLDLLSTQPRIPLDELLEKAEITIAPVRTLERNGAVHIVLETVYRDPHGGIELIRTEPMPLMPEQQTALERIMGVMDSGEPRPVLLQGVTGSGKTEVYLQAIAHALEKGEGAIVLVPEISLTPQTVDRFRARFGDTVAVLHSSLSDGERLDEWVRLRNGEAKIAIGARSALFAPVHPLGLIVVDEEHEPTYKQDEAPRYNARDAAVMRGHLTPCTVVLGSATPSLESWYNARAGKYEKAVLERRVDDRAMPHIRVVDMRLENTEDGKTHIFAKELLIAIQDRLQRAEQVILFLNRRGFSSSLLCPQCGHVANCDLCSVSMTYHKGAHRLCCHICGEERPVPDRCPACHTGELRYCGTGTEKIEELIASFFKQARICRMDSDTMRRKNAHRHALEDFRTGKIDILVGTQMIAKGLDFPNVTLVGVINADITLHMPDFRAGERTFQLLTQVAGRAGRGHTPGEVIVQTYTPFHQAIQAARGMSFDQFADQEIEIREALHYPPHHHLVCVTFRGPIESQTEQWAENTVRALAPHLPPEVVLSGPAPAPLARIKGAYRFQFMLRGPSAPAMIRPLKALLKTLKPPRELHATVDVDALNLM